MKTIKKPISILLSVLMVLSVFAVVPFTASAAELTGWVNVRNLSVGDIIGGGPHAWNIVVINGNPYNVDVTWNDEAGRQLNEKCHAFFNVSDSDINNTHLRDGLSLNLNPCPYDDMSYANAVGYTVTIDQIKMAPPAK